MHGVIWCTGRRCALMDMQDHLESVEFELDIGPCFVEYAAEKRGYTVTVGYVV